MTVVDILALPVLNRESVSVTLKWLSLIFIPSSGLGFGLQDIYTNYEYLKLCDSDIAKYLCSTNMTMPCCKGKFFLLFQHIQISGYS